MFVSPDTIDLLASLGVTGLDAVSVIRAFERDMESQVKPPASSRYAANRRAYEKRLLKSTELSTETPTELSTENLLNSVASPPRRDNPSRLVDINTPSEAKASSVPKGTDEGKSTPSSKAPKGALLAEDWRPSQSDFETAAKRGLTPQEIELETDKFRNHWCAATGPNSRKRSWPRAWDNWCIEAVRRRGGPRLAHSSAQPGGHGRGASSFADVYARRRGAGAD